MAAIVVLGGEDAPVIGGFAISEFFLFDHHAERVARPRVGVKIHVPSENGGESHGQFRLFSRIGYCLEERSLHFAGNASLFGLGRNCFDLGIKVRAVRLDGKHVVGVNPVAHFAQFAHRRAPDFEHVPGAQMAQIENRLRGNHKLGSHSRAEAHRLQKCAKRNSGRDRAPGEEYNLGANPLRFRARKRNLLRKLILRRQALPVRGTDAHRARDQQARPENHFAPVFHFPRFTKVARAATLPRRNFATTCWQDTAACA